MIDPMLALATFMPILFAIVATFISWKSNARRLLFFVVVLFSFVGLQDIAYKPLAGWLMTESANAYEVVRASTKARFAGDILSAVLGGIVAWRLHLGFRKGKAS